MVVTFCGHSQYVSSREDEQKILSLLAERVGDRPAELYLGGYGAFDAFALLCGKKYRLTHPNVKLILVTPYLTAKASSSPHETACYDATVYPALERVPPRLAILYRNRWMVEQADLIIAFVKHEWGGAYQTYCHAKKKQKEIFNLAQ